MKCKNDSTRTYKGTEPSPKGRGVCAHAEPVDNNRVKDGTNIGGLSRLIKTGENHGGESKVPAK